MIELTDKQVETLVDKYSDKMSVIGPISLIIDYEFVLYFNKNQQYYFAHINEFYRINNRFEPIRHNVFLGFLINNLLKRYLKRLRVI